jgi:transposase
VTALLKTAPGVATVVAAAFVSVIDEAERFRRAHEVESYLGLVPSEDTSGKRRLGAITKRGNTYARALLIQAAWAIIRSKGNDPLAEWGRGIALKRTKRVAAVAVARRLVGILWAMWRDGTVYEGTRVGSGMERGIEQPPQVRAAALRRAARKPMYSSSALLRKAR